MSHTPAASSAASGGIGDTGRTLVMGILNLTPDSFSDGGTYQDVQVALAHAEQMVREGADIIDLGGESTRPGAEPVSPAQEQARVLPVLEALLKRQHDGVAAASESQLSSQEIMPVASGFHSERTHRADFSLVRFSVDTLHADTAEAALELAGTQASQLIINDVSGLMTEERMPGVVASFGCEVVITHNRGDAKTMQQRSDYTDLYAELRDELKQVRQRYLDAGVAREKIILDPGIGFSKTQEQSLELSTEHLQVLVRESGHRVLLGVSRKGFLGTLLADAQGVPRPPEGRDTATALLSLHAATCGAWAVRVHQVEPNADAIRLASAMGAQPAWTPSPVPRADGSVDFAHIATGWQ